MKRIHLAWILAASLVGCAHGKMGNVEQGLQQGTVDKSTPIFVETIHASDTYISGDKAADKAKMDATRAKIEEQYNRLIVDALNKKGFNAKIASGPVTKGVVLSGKVTKIENGSAAARYFVGMGAGAANMFTSFKLEDRTAKKDLSKFEIIGTSGGSSGMGSFLDRHLADSSAKTAEYFETSLYPKAK